MPGLWMDYWRSKSSNHIIFKLYQFPSRRAPVLLNTSYNLISSVGLKQLTVIVVDATSVEIFCEPDFKRLHDFTVW